MNFVYNHWVDSVREASGGTSAHVHYCQQAMWCRHEWDRCLVRCVAAMRCVCAREAVIQCTQATVRPLQFLGIPHICRNM